MIGGHSYFRMAFILSLLFYLLISLGGEGLQMGIEREERKKGLKPFGHTDI